MMLLTDWLIISRSEGIPFAQFDFFHIMANYVQENGKLFIYGHMACIDKEVPITHNLGYMHEKAYAHPKIAHIVSSPTP